MMKISPFAGEGGARMPDAERVNLWPLVYHNRGATSVLWPIVDWDDEGFAVRPLINKERADWSVLFPLSGWNTDDGHGWVLTGYHGRDNTGVFPLFNIGEDFGYVGPAWWTDDGEHGAFPLYGRGENLRHIGPVWWHTDGESSGLFPLYDRHGTKHRSRHNLLFGMLAHLSDRGKDRYTQWVFPAWYADRDNNGTTRLLLPVFLYHADGDERVVLTPLGGRGWDRDADTFMINVAGPLYHYHSRDDHAFHAALWPVFTMSDGDTWRLWPLVSHTGDRGDAGPLHDIVLLGVTDRAHHKGVSCLGPLVFDYDRRVHADKRPDWDVNFLMLGRLWHTVYDRESVPHPRGHGWQSCIASRGRHFILSYHERETFRVWREGVLSDEDMQTLFSWWHVPSKAGRVAASDKVVEILRRHGVDVAGDAGRETLRRAVLDFAAVHTETSDTVTLGIPLLYKLKHSEDGTDWKVLFGAANGKRHADRSRLSILRHLYHRERDGRRVTRDIFPFITWDSAPDHTRFSFLWRLFHYTRDADGINGHVLFIPWGGAPDA